MEVEDLALDLRLDHGPIDLLDDDEQHADGDHTRKAGDHGGDDEDRDDGNDRPDDRDELGERQRGGEQQRIVADVGVDEDPEQVEPDQERDEDDPRNERRSASPRAEDVAKNLEDGEDGLAEGARDRSAQAAQQRGLSDSA